METLRTANKKEGSYAGPRDFQGARTLCRRLISTGLGGRRAQGRETETLQQRDTFALVAEFINPPPPPKKNLHFQFLQGIIASQQMQSVLIQLLSCSCSPTSPRFADRCCEAMAPQGPPSQPPRRCLAKSPPGLRRRCLPPLGGSGYSEGTYRPNYMTVLIRPLKSP